MKDGELLRELVASGVPALMAVALLDTGRAWSERYCGLAWGCRWYRWAAG